MKATKLTLAAALLFGSVGLAMAQGGDGGAGGGVGTKNEPARANDENPTGGANPRAGNPAAQQTKPMNTAPVGMSTGSTPSSAKTGTAPAKGIDTQGPDKIKPGSGE